MSFRVMQLCLVHELGSVICEKQMLLKTKGIFKNISFNDKHLVWSTSPQHLFGANKLYKN